MIIEWLMQMGVGFGSAFLGMLPSTDQAETLIVTASDAFSPIIAGGHSLGAWLPWSTLGSVLPVVLSFYIGAFAVKVLRQLATHFPLFGGTG